MPDDLTPMTLADLSGGDITSAVPSSLDESCHECQGSGFALPPASHPGWGRLAQDLITQEASLATPRGEA